MKYEITLREFVEKYCDADHWAYLLNDWYPDGRYPDNKRNTAKMLIPEAKKHLVEQRGFLGLHSAFYDFIGYSKPERIYIDVLFKDKDTKEAVDVFTLTTVSIDNRLHKTNYVLVTDITMPDFVAAQLALEKL